MSGALLITAVLAVQLGGPESGSAVVSADDPFGPLNELIESVSGVTPESGSVMEEYDLTHALTFGSGQRVHESGSGIAESGSGATFGFGSPPPGMYDNPPAGGSGPEAGSGVGGEQPTDPLGGRPDPFAAPRTRPPPPPLGGGFDADDLPPAAVRPARPANPPPAGDARVHALLVALGWIAALAAGGFAGYLLGVGRGEERRRRNLEPRQLDLAGEVAETADSLLAAADANEADRFAACTARLRERVGRTAVLLDDRAADAVRRLVSTAAAGPPTDEAGREGLRASYDGLVGALRKSVRGA